MTTAEAHKAHEDTETETEAAAVGGGGRGQVTGHVAADEATTMRGMATSPTAEDPRPLIHMTQSSGRLHTNVSVVLILSFRQWTQHGPHGTLM